MGTLNINVTVNDVDKKAAQDFMAIFQNKVSAIEDLHVNASFTEKLE